MKPVQNMSQSIEVDSSYPPLFRQTAAAHNPSTPPGVHSNIADDIAKQALNDFSSAHHDDDPLPIIDLHSIDQQSEREKLREACTDWGVFRLVNDGIPLTLLTQLHQHVEELFKLGFESKQDMFNSSPMTYFWGTPALTPAGVALQRAHEFNWVEGLNVPLAQLPMVPDYEDPFLHSFRFLLEEYGDHMSRVARKIFEAMTKNLKLMCPQTESYLSPSTGLLRLYRYPRYYSSTTPNKPPWGLNVHTDSSVISILNQDQVGGLQLYKNNIWLDVKPIPNTLVIHLGDMMQAISDDKYTSVKHRVKVQQHAERISMGYFVFPEEDCVIQSSKYKPFTCADFRAQVQQDIKTMGFKVGLQRFKLMEAQESAANGSET